MWDKAIAFHIELGIRDNKESPCTTLIVWRTLKVQRKLKGLISRSDNPAVWQPFNSNIRCTFCRGMQLFKFKISQCTPGCTVEGLFLDLTLNYNISGVLYLKKSVMLLHLKAVSKHMGGSTSESSEAMPCHNSQTAWIYLSKGSEGDRCVRIWKEQWHNSILFEATFEGTYLLKEKRRIKSIGYVHSIQW